MKRSTGGRAAIVPKRQRLGTSPRGFAVVQLASRSAPETIYTVWQDVAGVLWCDCREFHHEAATAPRNQQWRRGCRHTEIVETARQLAGAWLSTDDPRDRAAVLHLTPPPGSKPPTRMFYDE